MVRVGPRLRVTVKLIQASDQSQLWASEYDRDFSDIIEVQSEVDRGTKFTIRLPVGSPEPTTQRA